jgi:hypothetical protein
MQVIILIIIIGLSWWMLSAKFDILNKTIKLLNNWITKLNAYKDRLNKN